VSEIRIERAVAADFLAVAELDRRAWSANRNSQFIPDGEHVWRIWVEHALVFVAREDMRVVGAILCMPCIAGPWCLHKVFVDDVARGRGVGSKLFEALLAEVDRLKGDCFLTVDPVNAGAIALYTKWGFTEKRFVKGYYRENEDRFVMTRRWRGMTDAEIRMTKE